MSKLKVAVLQVADTGPLESLVVMLESAGYSCYLPDDSVKSTLRSIGCDTVLDVKALVVNYGYDEPMKLPTISLKEMPGIDLYVDVKGHRNGPKVEAHWPSLKGKVLWYRINGGKPEHVINARGDHGDEVNPPCPILTPNQWYRNAQSQIEIKQEARDSGMQFADMLLMDGINWQTTRAYTMWPPFYRWSSYRPEVRPTATTVIDPKKRYTPPVCFIHNLHGWGYSTLVPNVERLGVELYGARSPRGCISHKKATSLLTHSLCMVHLKSSDAPGYALYEALASGCPIILPRRLIWRCKMERLFEADKTCLVFDRETHDDLSQEDVAACTKEISEGLQRLRDPIENIRIGMAGRDRLRRLMWSQDSSEDVTSFRNFMWRCYGR